MSGPSGIQPTHSEIQELVPWWVIGRLSEADAAQVQAHLEECAECRADVAVERRILAAVRRRTPVEYAPQVAFQKLWSRIEEVEREVPSRPAPDTRGTEQVRRVAIDSRWPLAAGLVLGLGLGLLAAAWRQSTPSVEAPQYRTATTLEPGARATARIRVVFSPTVTVDELTGIVRGNRLAIVEGPSDSGVYALAIMPGAAVSVPDALARLRSDPRVRFAEPVTAAGAAPTR